MLIFPFDIAKVRIALVRPLIPAIHRINSLRKLSTASLIDAASVNPHVGLSMFLCKLATFLYFHPSCCFEVALLREFFEGGLPVFPSMRENRILWNLFAKNLCNSSVVIFIKRILSSRGKAVLRTHWQRCLHLYALAISDAEDDRTLAREAEPLQS